jgi:hypothetical protein
LPRVEATSWVNIRELAAQLCEVVIDRFTLLTNRLG